MRPLLQRLGDNVEAAPSRADVERQLDAQNGAPQAGRSREQVIVRAMERGAEAASMRLDPAIAGVISKLFGISGPAEEAVVQIRALLAAADIKLDAPLAALEAAIVMRREVPRLESDQEEGLILRIGVHSGPCIAVESNDRLDYFGQTVNIACRLLRLARGELRLNIGHLVSLYQGEVLVADCSFTKLGFDSLRRFTIRPDLNAFDARIATWKAGQPL